MDPQVKGATTCHHFRQIAQKLWNEAIEESVQPKSFKNGVLKIVVINSGWAQQVQFKRAEILKLLQEASPEIRIKGLRVKVEPFSS